MGNQSLTAYAKNLLRLAMVVTTYQEILCITENHVENEKHKDKLRNQP